jgi:hypothetical protein
MSMKPTNAALTLAVLVSVPVSFCGGVIVARIFPGGLMPEFLGRLHRWQELIGAILGAGALASTFGGRLDRNAENEMKRRMHSASRLVPRLGSSLQMSCAFTAKFCSCYRKMPPIHGLGTTRS